MTSTETDAARWLLTPEAVRTQCAKVLAACEQDALEHFRYCPDRLDVAVDVVIDTMQQNYPGGTIPFHARWRHFVVDGMDRTAAMLAPLADNPPELARARVDLAVTSVLLDAGAGERWSYRDQTSGRTMARSEGLAIASLDAFAAGAFSSDPDCPERADADALRTLDTARLGRLFQVSEENPLAGLEGRAALLNRVGETLAARPDVFGGHARIGALADFLIARATDGRLPARDILVTLLDAFGAIWPGRLTLGGVGLGDTWRHPAADCAGPADGLVPFHKLSQWLAYSLIEPLQDAGITVTDIDGLTGLAEYRNGGLMVDSGLLEPRHDAVTGKAHAPDSDVIVEWRALTVALLDRIAQAVRLRLGLDAKRLPLASVLEGGTWHAGRRLAAQRRDNGGPPITIISDGSVF